MTEDAPHIMHSQPHTVIVHMQNISTWQHSTFKCFWHVSSFKTCSSIQSSVKLLENALNMTGAALNEVFSQTHRLIHVLGMFSTFNVMNITNNLGRRCLPYRHVLYMHLRCHIKHPNTNRVTSPPGVFKANINIILFSNAGSIPPLWEYSEIWE